MRVIFIILVLALFWNEQAHSTEKQKEYQKTIQADTTTKNQLSTSLSPISISVNGITQHVGNQCDASDCNKEPDGWIDKFLFDPVATFTGLLFFATIGLIVTGIIQWCALSKTVNAMREDFIATHRPQIRIKHMWLRSQSIWNGAPISIQVVWVNTGKSTAHVREINATAYILEVPSIFRLPIGALHAASFP